MWGMKAVGAAVLAAVVMSFGPPPQAQWGDPFASLEYGVRPACPFDCDSVTLRLAGELTSTNWKIPELMSWSRDSDSISVQIRVEYDLNPGLPVLVPFELLIPLGMLPENTYLVVYTIYLDNPLSTMPMIPFVTVTDKFTVAPPGDQDCDADVDVLDVVRSIHYVFRGGSPTDPARRADVNCDGVANVSDVIQLIYHAFRGGSVCDPCAVGGILPLVITDIPPDSLRRDNCGLIDGQTVGNLLHLRIGYGGGCMVHSFAVFMTPPRFEGTEPRVAHLYPQHTDPGDPCDAWPTESMEVDLRLLAMLYQSTYGNEPADVIVRVHDYNPANTIDVPYHIAD